MVKDTVYVKVELIDLKRTHSFKFEIHQRVLDYRLTLVSD